MSTKRVIALVIGVVMILPALGMLLGGGALALAYATQRDDDGFFDVTIDQLQTPTAAITGEDVTFATDPGSPDWLIDAIDLDVRLRATALDSDAAVFVGIARQSDLDRYLAGVAHDRVVEIVDGVPVYRLIPGETDAAEPPGEADIWVARAEGTGTQELTWEPTGGRWAAMVANADGSPGLAVAMEVGAKSGLVLPIAVTLTVLGLIGVVIAVVLIVYGASDARRRDVPADGASGDPASPLPPPAPSSADAEQTVR
jgi:hypothetical protein